MGGGGRLLAGPPANSSSRGGVVVGGAAERLLPSRIDSKLILSGGGALVVASGGRLGSWVSSPWRNFLWKRGAGHSRGGQQDILWAGFRSGRRRCRQGGGDAARGLGHESIVLRSGRRGGSVGLVGESRGQHWFRGRRTLGRTVTVVSCGGKSSRRLAGMHWRT